MKEPWEAVPTLGIYACEVSLVETFCKATFHYQLFSCITCRDYEGVMLFLYFFFFWSLAALVEIRFF